MMDTLARNYGLCKLLQPKNKPGKQQKPPALHQLIAPITTILVPLESSNRNRSSVIRQQSAPSRKLTTQSSCGSSKSAANSPSAVGLFIMSTATAFQNPNLNVSNDGCLAPYGRRQSLRERLTSPRGSITSADTDMSDSPISPPQQRQQPPSQTQARKTSSTSVMVSPVRKPASQRTTHFSFGDSLSEGIETPPPKKDSKELSLIQSPRKDSLSPSSPIQQKRWSSDRKLITTSLNIKTHMSLKERIRRSYSSENSGEAAPATTTVSSQLGDTALIVSDDDQFDKQPTVSPEDTPYEQSDNENTAQPTNFTNLVKEQLDKEGTQAIPKICVTKVSPAMLKLKKRAQSTIESPTTVTPATSDSESEMPPAPFDRPNSVGNFQRHFLSVDYPPQTADEEDDEDVEMPELLLTLVFQPHSSRCCLSIVRARNISRSLEACSIRVSLANNGVILSEKETKLIKCPPGSMELGYVFTFALAAKYSESAEILIMLLNKDGNSIGSVQLSDYAEQPTGCMHWNRASDRPNLPYSVWHKLQPSDDSLYRHYSV